MKLSRIVTHFADLEGLLKAGSASAKAKGVRKVRDALETLNQDASVEEFCQNVEAAREEIKLERISSFVNSLRQSEGDETGFAQVLDELRGRAVTSDEVKLVAIGYVKGRPTYASKSAAIKAIRDKRVELLRMKSRVDQFKND